MYKQDKQQDSGPPDCRELCTRDPPEATAKVFEYGPCISMCHLCFDPEARYDYEGEEICVCKYIRADPGIGFGALNEPAPKNIGQCIKDVRPYVSGGGRALLRGRKDMQE